MKDKVELLAPAGNYEAFLGAVNAGADAVYLGGEKFGARAYAGNFTTEEICSAIHVAHIMGRKIYLTVNTLLKDAEMEELVPYLRPFYEAGLDGVIIQDIGVLGCIRENYPELALHASTQMTLAGVGGCAFLKEQGVERIVPARELSLREIKEIKEQTGLEIECFIHGAMCYCYSGQCLFSSILGGRSGNRGRCAQPCRLPYRIVDGRTEITGVEYPLSLKDMCTLSYIPELIAAGIDSFKIEGRMKRAEYAAGVTALYRKYIDLYYRVGKEKYEVDKADLAKLQSLYIRSEIQTGYYERHNGREMVTLHKPSYAGNDEAILEEIRAAYLREPDKITVQMEACLETGKPAFLRIADEKTGISVSVSGAVAETAQKAPLKPEDVRKRLFKTGNSCVSVSSCEITMQDTVFLNVMALNELRREGIAAFERQYILKRGMVAGRICPPPKPTWSVNNTKTVSPPCPEPDVVSGTAAASHSGTEYNMAAEEVRYVDILVSTYEQLAEAAGHTCRRIYIESDLYLTRHPQVAECMAEHRKPEYYIALPYVIRSGDTAYMRKLTRLLKQEQRNRPGDDVPDVPKGFLVRNYEGAAYACSLQGSYAMVPDAGLYCFNTESTRFWAHYSKEYTLPYELNSKEAGKLARQARSLGMAGTMIVYGQIPMMVTANCVSKTAGQCPGKEVSGRQMFLKDRYGITFPVEINCIHCYNIIYNSVPFSLHMQQSVVKRIGADAIRYDFTAETAGECRKILQGREFPFESYTTGHLKRGVE